MAVKILISRWWTRSTFFIRIDLPKSLKEMKVKAVSTHHICSWKFSTKRKLEKEIGNKPMRKSIVSIFWSSWWHQYSCKSSEDLLYNLLRSMNVQGIFHDTWQRWVALYCLYQEMQSLGRVERWYAENSKEWSNL